MADDPGRPGYGIPLIGQVVVRNGQRDWLCQLRLGDELFVLVWGATRERWQHGDAWEEAHA